MAQAVDVYVTSAELEEALKARTSCMKIDREALVPVHCVSKRGISTSTLFSVRSKRPIGRGINDTEMGLMYDKFVGPGSLGNAAVRQEQHERSRSIQSSVSADGGGAASVAVVSAAGSVAAVSRAPSIDSGDRAPPPPSPSMAVVIAAAGSLVKQPALDAEYQQQASSAVTMKYISPHIAKKYGINQHIRPASAAATAAAASKAARMASGVAAAAAAAMVSAEAGTSDHPSRPMSGHGHRPPRPPSASFSTTSRDQAQRAGYFVYCGPVDVPAPGRYTPQYNVTGKVPHVVSWGKRPSMGSDGAAAVGGSGSINLRRPGSAPAGGRSASITRPTSGSIVGNVSGHHHHRASDEGPMGQSQHHHDSPSRSRSISSHQPHPNGNANGIQHGLPLDGKAQRQQRHAEMFAGAHRVHPPKHEKPPGSSAFLVAPRKPRSGMTEAGPLFGEYYWDGYDKLTYKTPKRPSSAFHIPAEIPQSAMRQAAPAGGTGPALGPGAYNPKAVPATYTGQHVTAGHPPLARTPDWSRTTPRPTSAPPARPTSAGAAQPAYWGPEDPDDPAYSDLVALQALQARMQHDQHRSQQQPPPPPAPPQQPQQQQSPSRARSHSAAKHPRHQHATSSTPRSSSSFASPGRPQSARSHSHSSTTASSKTPTKSRPQTSFSPSRSRPQSARPTTSTTSAAPPSSATGAIAAAVAASSTSSISCSPHHPNPHHLQPHPQHHPQQQHHPQHHPQQQHPQQPLPAGLADYPGEPGRWGDTRPLVYVDPARHGELGSSGLAPRVPGGAFGQATRQAAAKSLRAMSQSNVIPPSSVAVRDLNDLTYNYDVAVESHRPRQPAWALPPNRTALSKKWVAAAATAYL
ncbi:hypothetical protein Agub_g5505 [Astrephomene gubernaculifera]|uniref:Uncharacterized protein n=1 Tax=Astrephomene gubernaculifera TaxID=47775 RepID=A0AAD3DLY3_9CHLO|nr:hypothetical protein Agub_g5505 [Astrephomene gubernaculifera]